MSMYFQPNSDDKNNVKVLLSLLEKAELIMSIVNLPDTTINKYNHLKEITFEKLNLEFTPINIKRQGKSSNISVRNINSTASNFYENISSSNTNMDHFLNRLRSINARKTVIIEYLFELIEKFRLENNNYMRQYLLDNANFNLGFLIDKTTENVNNLSRSANFYDDLDFELKLEELKIKDFLGKSDICYRKFLANLKNLNIQNLDNYNNTSNYTKAFNQEQYLNVNEIADRFQSNLEQLKLDHEQEIKEYREKFNELRNKYNPDLEAEYLKLRDSYNTKSYIIDEINNIVDPIYEKYYSKNTSWYEKVMIDFKYEDLTKIHFLTSLVNKFFSDNKYLLDMVSHEQKEKAALIEERNLPFVLNTIQKHSTLEEIHSDLMSFEKNNDLVYKNIDQVLDYMTKNIEGLL